ncbi:TonB family protein (plasmid) [Pedobacter sp. BS3]|uniref:energy transducer TonB n=1 Tax=Pedobacter sp. BS3 TaxID=2567937 RepID=UPI0011EC8983|nr:energy transducer TonB [Pedobacter sp. BS3]TZF85597.1 TonB family protein [Pedobacter sp. BS3]
MKKVLLLICLLSGITLTYAQKKQKVWYFTNDGREVNNRDSSDYTRIVESEENAKNFTLREYYYPNNTLKTTGSVSSFDPRLVYEGEIISYYKNGQKKSVKNYVKGRPVGLATTYYTDGKLEARMNYSGGININEPAEPAYILIEYYDTQGNALVKDGNGSLSRWNTDSTFVEEGAFLNGVKTGTWTGKSLKSGLSYKEEYTNGKFVKGVTTTSKGKKISYADIVQLPQFDGGIKKFYKYISENFVYPPSAKKDGVSGMEVVSFTVEKDGSITNVKVLRSLGAAIDREAIRIMQESPAWIPAKRRGIPSPIKYTIPIRLNLESR